jgi:hypothetical protein
VSDGQPAFIPTSAQLERTLRALQACYPRCTLDECRNAVAAMYGHADWQQLPSAVQSAHEASPCDEEMPREVVNARFQQQYDGVVAGLGCITDETMLAAQALDQELLAVDRESITGRYDPAFNGKRLQRAHYAWNLLYARHVVLDVRPTAQEAARIPLDREDIDLSFRIDLLPRALRAWIAHHRPLLREWGERVGRIEVRQHAPTDLLRFSYCWGEACLECAVDIPKPLQIYPIALSAKWFGWIACSRMPRLQNAFAELRSDAGSEAERRSADNTISEAIREEEARFILAQPREDFRGHSASAREQHIHAGYALVRRWISEAATRSTVRGIMSRSTWTPLSPALPGG